MKRARPTSGRSEHLAADLTADVFLRAIESAESYDPRLGPPAAWLTGVARNVVAMLLRPDPEGGSGSG